MKDRFGIGFLSAAVVVSLLVGFTLGTRQDDVMIAFGLKPADMSQLDFRKSTEVYEKLVKNFDGEISAEDASNYAAKGVAAASEDAYTTYLTKEETEEIHASLEGDIGGGIGAELGRADGGVKIIRALKDTPADRAGLKSGDLIAKVNGREISGMEFDEVVNAIRGEIGTTVKLEIIRDGDIKDFSIEREKIVAPSVEAEIIDGVGVITLSRFGEDSAEKVRLEAEKMKAEGVSGVVLDLRGNGGGYLKSGVDVASVWLKDKVVVKERGKNIRDKELKSASRPVLEGFPTVVLINEVSASASEIVAGALKDHQAAKIFGKTSFGKGSVQELIDMKDGASLKVTTSKWYTPNGKSIQESGIKPDKEVDFSAKEMENGQDRQLNEAVGYLKK